MTKKNGSISDIQRIEQEIAEIALLLHDGKSGEPLFGNADVKFFTMVYEVNLHGKEFYIRIAYDYRTDKATITIPEGIFGDGI